MVTEFSFGKYTGRSFENVWTGIPDNSDADICKSYLQEIFDYVSGVTPKSDKFYFSTADLAICRDDLIKTTNSNFKITVTDKYIAIQNYTDVVNSKLKEIISAVMTIGFRNVNGNLFRSLLKNEIILWPNFTDNSAKFASLQSDPDYICYTIREIPEFCINPKYFSGLIEKRSRWLDYFEINYLKPDLIEYRPIFRDFQYEVSNDITEINIRKYQTDESTTANSG